MSALPVPDLALHGRLSAVEVVSFGAARGARRVGDGRGAGAARTHVPARASGPARSGIVGSPDP